MKTKNKGPRSKMEARKSLTGYLFLAPFLVLFATFTLIPIAVAMGLSLTNYNLIQTPDFVGLTNYMNLILEDDVFLTSLANTLFFAILTGPLGYIASFVMAWLITLMKKGKGPFSLAFYAPSLTSGVAMSTIWLIIFSGDRNGYLNNFLMDIGLIVEPILWTKDADYLKWVIVIISVWMSMGTGFLVFLAGLQNIDPALYEAAKVDGMKSRLQELRYITLPLMKPQLLFGAVNSVVGAFAIFDVATSVAGMPSPNYAAHTIVAHLYDYAFIRMNMGYASGVAMILFIMTFVVGRICFYVFRSEED
ncbi:MAG: sugar ABC transporter permease [Lachnospiraceae bacterium]|nr:sugar ABC transporter permease [Lachnospiraceae bacterium]